MLVCALQQIWRQATKMGHSRRIERLPTPAACPRLLRSRPKFGVAVKRRDVPCVDGSELARTFLTPQAWSVQPCVRPVCAVHMIAGHNALRGSGPGQKPAFENAVAQVDGS